MNDGIESLKGQRYPKYDKSGNLLNDFLPDFPEGNR